MDIDKKYILYIIKKLEENNTNYIVIDIINNNDVIINRKFENNSYNRIRKTSKRYLKNKYKIDRLISNLYKLDINKLKRINDYLNNYG